MLYAYLYAAKEQTLGNDCRVLAAPVMAAWLPHYPRLRAELSIERADVGWRDRREWTRRDRYGTDFTKADLEAFVSRFLVEGLDPRPSYLACGGQRPAR